MPPFFKGLICPGLSATVRLWRFMPQDGLAARDHLQKGHVLRLSG